jgi:hypothetical protein
LNLQEAERLFTYSAQRLICKKRKTGLEESPYLVGERQGAGCRLSCQKIQRGLALCIADSMIFEIEGNAQKITFTHQSISWIRGYFMVQRAEAHLLSIINLEC